MRAMTAHEQSVLEAMIRHASPFDSESEPPSITDRARWLAMIKDLSVHRLCGCGTCPTIDLAYKGVPVESGEHTTGTILEAGIREAMILLFINNDIPGCLEVAPINDEPVALPSPEEIRFR